MSYAKIGKIIIDEKRERRDTIITTSAGTCLSARDWKPIRDHAGEIEEMMIELPSDGFMTVWEDNDDYWARFHAVGEFKLYIPEVRLKESNGVRWERLRVVIVTGNMTDSPILLSDGSHLLANYYSIVMDCSARNFDHVLTLHLLKDSFEYTLEGEEVV